MNKGIKTVIYPVKDIMQTKTVFRKLLGVEPYADQPAGRCLGGRRRGEAHLGRRERAVLAHRIDPRGDRLLPAKGFGLGCGGSDMTGTA